MVAAGLAWAGPYWRSLTSDILIILMLGVSLQAMMALGGLVSLAMPRTLAWAPVALPRRTWHGVGNCLRLSAGIVLAVALAVPLGSDVGAPRRCYLAVLSL